MREGWEIKKLGDVFDIKSSKRVHKKDWKNEGIPFYRAREVVKLSEYGEVKNELFISTELYQEFTKDKGSPKEDDIIVSAVGTLGKCYLVKRGDKFYIKDASVLWFEKISNIESRYVDYAFKSDLILKQVLHKSMGATVGTLTISRAKKIRIPIPPLPEQKRIVSILDRAFEAIDKAKANAEQNRNNAKELFESYLQGVFENKGDDWEEKTIAEVTRIVAGGTPKTGIKEYWDGDIAWITPADLGKLKTREVSITRRTISDIGLQKSSSKLFPENSVILSSRAPIGHLAINLIPMATNQGCRGIVPKEGLDTIFLYYFLKGNISLLNDLGTGATFKELSTKALGSVSIPLPPLPEQKKIVNKLDALSSETKKLEAIYQQKIDDLEELKKSVLQKAFRGKL